MHDPKKERLLCDPLPGVDRVTVWGGGWTGVCAANLLCSFGKHLIVTDTRPPAELQTALVRLAEQQQTTLDPAVEIRHGEHCMHDAQVVVLTQSVKPWAPEVVRAQELGVPIIPEVELVSRALQGTPVKLVVIGGTDGKTTTTKLAGSMVSAQCPHALVGGNSWLPLSGAAQQLEGRLLATDSDASVPVLVGEISAFQLPPWHSFRPAVAAVTNIAEDHVEEFFQGSMDAYIAAKKAITEHLPADSYAVLNVDDPIVRSWEPELSRRGVRVVRTSLASRAVGAHPWAVFRSNGELRIRWDGAEESFIEEAKIPLRGDHNVENVMTALATVLPLGLSREKLRSSLLAYSPPHHRLEPVAVWNGVEIVDDSKATNTHAAMAGLSAFGARSLVAIVGGVDKGLDLDAWVEALRNRARVVIVIGELRDKLLGEYAERLPQAQAAGSLKVAVDMALAAAVDGEVVVLSPACSSFDMFTSYADRGRQFQDAVHLAISRMSNEGTACSGK